MSAKRSVAVTIRGREFHIRSDEEPEVLQRIARYVDETMNYVEQRTGTVDSRDVALLAALNMARELLEEKDRNAEGGADPERLRALIDRVESAALVQAG
ncbi:MAG: cell division protein ZapA [Myxococcales bacterium]|nr:cell division protein ZapA [Acidobacteriota bacterium]MDH5308062.1 cell division protein ZapA [Myxococcales bacterium]MDH5567347.1 cell division protein ZapA [Myxococcales bacterium]